MHSFLFPPTLRPSILIMKLMVSFTLTLQVHLGKGTFNDMLPNIPHSMGPPNYKRKTFPSLLLEVVGDRESQARVPCKLM